MYCPTYIMLADYYTKALQGKLFTQLRDTIMGKISVYEIVEVNTRLKERVEKCISAGENVSLDFLSTIQKRGCRSHTRKGSPATENPSISTSGGQTKSYADALRKSLLV